MPNSYTHDSQNWPRSVASRILNANEFIYAAAEEDPDPLIRIAAMVQLLRRKTSDDTNSRRFAEEAENPRVYSLGLMLLDELPKHHLEDVMLFKALEGRAG